MRASKPRAGRHAPLTLAAGLALAPLPAAQDAPPPPWVAPRAFPAPEELAPNAALPDPLTFLDGTPVRTPEDWRERRRPELKALFLHYVYGYQPPAPAVRVELATSAELFDGRARFEELVLSFEGLPPEAPKIRLALFLPAAVGRAPVFLGMNKCGNHTVLDFEGIAAPEGGWVHGGCRVVGRGAKAEVWAIENAIARGYGIATFRCGDVDPDRDDFGDGVHPWFDVAGAPETSWGTLSAWAWGLSRCVDVLVEHARVDPARVAVIGHSRRGKTALLAGALDERIALVVPHQSGTGGCALSRDNDQETVARINEVLPHWFNDVFPRFGGGNEARLPIDQHLLVALVAPRPLLETVGLQDTWANYESSLVGLRRADRVWAFLGVEGMIGGGVVEEGEGLTARNAGGLVQYRRDTGHVLDVGYWNAVFDYADFALER